MEKLNKNPQSFRQKIQNFAKQLGLDGRVMIFCRNFPNMAESPVAVRKRLGRIQAKFKIFLKILNNFRKKLENFFKKFPNLLEIQQKNQIESPKHERKFISKQVFLLTCINNFIITPTYNFL